MRVLRIGLAAATLLALTPAIAAAYYVSFDYYAYATSSDGVTISDDQTLQDQAYVDGEYTKTGDFGNFGTCWFAVDLMDRSVSATAHSHGLVFDPWPHYAVGSGRVNDAIFSDRVTFTAPAGLHADGLFATMTGTMQGTISSDVGAGAKCQLVAYLGAQKHDTGLITVGIDVANTIVVDEAFTLIQQIVAPGTTLSHPTDYSYDVKLGMWNGNAWSVNFNTGSGYVSGDGDLDFDDGLRITSLTASDGVTFVSESGAFSDGVTGVPDAARMQLHQNAPNPFNPGTRIAFTLSEATRVDLRVYDLAGRLVATLLDGAPYGTGRHEAFWDGRDAAGREAAAGTYFYRIEAAGGSRTRPMVLVK